jgi:SAM-dependent methyltransferase
MWNHNTHFHEYLLRQCRSKLRYALDVGSGYGVFAQRLSALSLHVDAIESDPTVVNEASRRVNAHNVHFLCNDFLQVELPKNYYDLVSAIASLHHMDIRSALEKMKSVLCPGGTLLVLGLYRDVTLADYLYSAASVPLNFVLKRWYGGEVGQGILIAPTCSPTLALSEIETASRTMLPGFWMRRHLLWRYSLIWRKPLQSN